MRFLLDVNVLLAYQYPMHIYHARVRSWISKMRVEPGHDDGAFATCPITELGFVRIASGKAGLAVSVESARSDLRTLKSSENMLFIADDLHTRHLPGWVRKSAQTTDGYLLALARSHGGHLATLDRFIPGAEFIPDETAGPLMVREETMGFGWAAAHVEHGARDQSSSRGIATP